MFGIVDLLLSSFGFRVRSRIAREVENVRIEKTFLLRMDGVEWVVNVYQGLVKVRGRVYPVRSFAFDGHKPCHWVSTPRQAWPM